MAKQARATYLVKNSSDKKELLTLDSMTPNGIARFIAEFCAMNAATVSQYTFHMRTTGGNDVQLDTQEMIRRGKALIK